VRPQRPTLRQLERGVERFLPQELELYFDDIVDASERIWDNLDNYKEVVEALEDTNESVISHRVNNVLRVLTSFSVVILPLTLLASIWGMNVGVPGQGSMHAFWEIIGVMVATLAGMLSFFRWRGWLDHGAALILVTHNVPEGLALATHAAIMTGGRFARFEPRMRETGFDVQRYAADYRSLVRHE
jgi:hypothetical protein